MLDVQAVIMRRPRVSLMAAAAVALGAVAASAPAASAVTCTAPATDTGYGTCQVEYTPTGAFTFTPPGGVTSVDVLVVGGGGAGGNTGQVMPTGGGGGGQVVVALGHAVSAATTYAGTVGAGGDGRGQGTDGEDGDDSAFDTLTAEGGTGGGHVVAGVNGGSAFPYSWWVSPPAGCCAGGAGVQVTPGVFTFGLGGGGGGSGAAGQAGSASGGGAGGQGANVASTFPGLTPSVFGGGGGGGSMGLGGHPSAGAGGAGGGGGGGRYLDYSSTPGTANTGGGGGGNVSYTPDSRANGGSGIVVIRYVPLEPPSVPIITVASAGNGTATITVTPGTGPGGAPDSFEVTASPMPGSGAGTCTIALPATSCTITGLTNGTAYTFTATATNVAGTSGPSVASTAVTPFDPTPAPAPAPTPSNDGSNSNSNSDGKTTPKATPGTPTNGKGTMRVPVSTTGAGTAVVLGNRTGGPGKGAALMCTAKTRFTKAGTKTLICVPTTTAQALRRKGDVRVRLVLSFKPKGAKATRTVVGAATMPRITDPAGRVTG